MKRKFQNRLEAIDWIAINTDDEGQFEVLREELNFNFIYTGELYLELTGEICEVVLLDKNRK